jgi:predicted nucleotide-binding protein (sugar kinase/HSP70/actin superfamily)
MMSAYGILLDLKKVKNAASKAYLEYENHMQALRSEAEKYISYAREKNLPVIVLCGRPYHIDPEINHGISRLICDLGAVVVSEDSVCANIKRFKTSVLNQWTYHSRLYAAAKYVANNKENVNMNLVQLVSFGCGLEYDDRRHQYRHVA